jgi:hypothetical protein
MFRTSVERVRPSRARPSAGRTAEWAKIGRLDAVFGSDARRLGRELGVPGQREENRTSDRLFATDARISSRLCRRMLCARVRVISILAAGALGYSIDAGPFFLRSWASITMMPLGPRT